MSDEVKLFQQGVPQGASKNTQDGNVSTKRAYQTPSIQSEKIEQALLAAGCNGMSSGGGRKAAAPCTVLLS